MTKPDVDRDKRGRRLTLDQDQRRERARAAGQAAHSVSAYVRKIVKNAPALTDADIAALRQLVAPAVHEAYQDGVKAGARLAVESITDKLLAG